MFTIETKPVDRNVFWKIFREIDNIYPDFYHDEIIIEQDQSCCKGCEFNDPKYEDDYGVNHCCLSCEDIQNAKTVSIFVLTADDDEWDIKPIEPGQKQQVLDLLKECSLIK